MLGPGVLPPAELHPEIISAKAQTSTWGDLTFICISFSLHERIADHNGVTGRRREVLAMQPSLFVRPFIGAALFAFPSLYVFDVAVTGHKPGWHYVIAATLATMAIGTLFALGGRRALEKPVALPGSMAWFYQPDRDKDAPDK